MNTPGDWIGWGALILFAGSVAAAALAATTDEPLAALVALPVGVVGGVMVQVGVIGWGVALDIRQAESRHDQPRAAQPRSQPGIPQQPTLGQDPRPQDPNLPPWDQPEGRGYR